MVYTKLLINAGGGIISAQQQSQQAVNTASVLIGLGGTGIDCIRTIKTQVYSRLLPDNPSDVIPRYDHIRFIGVDADKRSIGASRARGVGEKPDARLRLDEGTEFFPIYNSVVGAAIKNSLALATRPEMSWVNTETPPPNASSFGAGAIRQIGRFMLMDKADNFMNAVTNAIRGAKTNLVNPSVNIHIFAGISGGTGSGIFLDVCYMIRKLTQGEKNVKIFGYFFLPDVNYRRIDLDEGVITIDMMKRNGYAAMQELDYCMNLPDNGGSFVQVYKGGSMIEWNQKPVDMCHLICSADEAGNVIPNPYEYAMNVASEYVMDFLTAPISDEYDLNSHQANFVGQVTTGDVRKILGVNLAYCVIGAASASLPLREINTYLASKLFGKFAKIGDAIPYEQDVNELAIAALGRGAADSVDDIYYALLDELKTDTGADAFNYYDQDFSVILNGDEDFTHFYTTQLAERRGAIEKNCASMKEAANAASVLGRIKSELLKVMRDVERGPIFAYRMLAASTSHNLLNIISGLKATNDANLSQAEYEIPTVRDSYEQARLDFLQKTKRSLLDSNKKRFLDYENATQNEVRAQLEVDLYKQLGSLLTELEQQVENIASSYYIRLARVMTNLLETFHVNSVDLSNGNIAKTDTFSIPLLTIDEIQQTLDKEIEKLDVPNMLSAFMTLLVNNETAWLQEDENRIARLVTDFFVKTAFGDYANRSITSFLQDKYRAELGQNPNNLQLLSDLIYRDWMKLLTQKASPLFIRDSHISALDGSAGLSYISLPQTSSAITDAANRMHEANGKWNIKESALTDRIFVMCSQYVLPLGSYGEQSACADAYYGGITNGVHIYEGADVPGMRFKDWGKLAPITPNYYIKLDSISARAAETVKPARELYVRAVELNLIDRDNWICGPKDEELAALRALTQECAAAAAAVSSVKVAEENRALLERLEGMLSLTMVRKTPMQHDGSSKEEDQQRVRLDHFVSSPVFQMEVREIAESAEQAISEGRRAAEALRAAIDKRKADVSNIKTYCDALFTGVIAASGYSVSFEKEDIFGKSQVTLCEFGMPYASIPVYQGFVSYKALSEEDKEGIVKQVTERLKANDPRIKEAMRELSEGILAQETMAAYKQYSEDMENGSDALEFIKLLHQNFRTFSANIR